LAGATGAARKNGLARSQLRDFLDHREPVIEKNLNDPASLPFFQHLLGFARDECLSRYSLADPETKGSS